MSADESKILARITAVEGELRALTNTLAQHINQAEAGRKLTQQAAMSAREDADASRVAADRPEMTAKKAEKILGKNRPLQAGEELQPRGGTAPAAETKRFATGVSSAVWVACILATLAIGLVIAGSLPEGLTLFFAPIILFAMGLFGCLGLVAALREGRPKTSDR